MCSLPKVCLNNKKNNTVDLQSIVKLGVVCYRELHYA